MAERICPVCSNTAFPRLVKGTTQYWQCWACDMLYCDFIEQDGKVGGGNEELRNKLQNPLRIERLDILFKGKKRSDINVLDYGAGFGKLVNDMNEAGYIATPYDAYNPEFSRLPQKNAFEAITCIECVEHLAYPFPEIEVMYRSLKKYGLIMFETSFVDVAAEENIPLEEFPYISVEAGHCSIFSHHSLDLLMVGRGFKVGRHFNRHVRIYYKA